MLDSFRLLDKVITYVKDEGSNLNTLTFALTFIVSCFAFQQACPFVGSCFGHAMSKEAQYVTNDNNVCVGFLEVSLKEAQFSLQKTITWIIFLVRGGRSGKNLVLLEDKCQDVKNYSENMVCFLSDPIS